MSYADYLYDELGIDSIMSPQSNVQAASTTADTVKTAPAPAKFFDSILGYVDKVGSIYQKVELAQHGVNSSPTVIYETNGSRDPLVQAGAGAAVTASDPIANAIRDGVDGLKTVGIAAAGVAGAHEVRKMLPMLVGGMALAITIYLLTKK